MPHFKGVHLYVLGQAVVIAWFRALSFFLWFMKTPEVLITLDMLCLGSVLVHRQKFSICKWKIGNILNLGPKNDFYLETGKTANSAHPV
jgi:hypothetical protein